MVKTKSNPNLNPFLTSCVNPWLNISWQNTIASCDMAIINPVFCAQKGIDITNLPEPYSGNIDSNVVCLNLNPGIGPCDKCFMGDKVFLKKTQDNLAHKSKDFLWLSDIKCKNGGLHDGCKWWQIRTKDLRNVINSIPLNIFVLEYFPYHTQHVFNFPTLPSDEYRNALLCKAMSDQKLIVIMRGEKQWYNIVDKANIPIGKQLQRYPNLIVLSNPQNVVFSAKNCGKGWGKLLTALKKPVVKKYSAP